jgi:exosortase/archaeosortase family protein
MEARKLTVVALMGFPWIFIDFSFLGWWFRLTGAWVTGSVFQILRFDVIREGTAFWVQGVPIAVEAACAGMNSLQMLMVTGFFLNYLYNRKSPVFWWNALLIMALAWAANTLRVIALSTAAMTYGAEFASGPFHSSSGLFVVGVMLLICWPIMTWQRNTCQQD